MPRFRGMESTALHAANIALAVQQQTCEQRSRVRCFHRLFLSGSTTMWMSGLAASATVERCWVAPRMAPMCGGAGSCLRVVFRSAAKGEGGLWALHDACMSDVWMGGERAGRRIATRFGRVCEAVPPPVLCLASCLDHACSLPTGR